MCDGDGVVNGACTFRVGVCVNNVHPRLVKSGVAACTPSNVGTWELKKPRPTSTKPPEAVNAVALRDAVAALGGGTIGGNDPERVTFAPALDVLEGLHGARPGDGTVQERGRIGQYDPEDPHHDRPANRRQGNTRYRRSQALLLAAAVNCPPCVAWSSPRAISSTRRHCSKSWHSKPNHLRRKRPRNVSGKIAL